MRITNIDTLSALYDRLICENIKLFFFKKDGKDDLVTHQEIVIEELRNRIAELFDEVIVCGSYQYLSENRTFCGSDITEELEDLVTNDLHIGESDRARLAQVKSGHPKLEVMTAEEKRLRKANEGRARNKNTIDKQLATIIEEVQE